MRSFRTSFLSLAGSALVLAGLAPEATAQDAELLSIAEPETILEIAKGFGAAELTKDSADDPMLTGRVQGLKYLIYFYDCVGGENCKSLQFSTGYTEPFTAEKANEWNAKYRWIKAYASDDGSNFKMDVGLDGGISKGNLEDYFATWDSLMFDLRTFMREG